ncbi:Dyp-type peroxidase [Salinimonas sediminis]|uniref:Dyp-type peroxidase n=1 Tax=Salinimonas sediminis TaxID=2303538 RepID=A0A346NI16_9ALTE|nr:Dyp-type peroxidase [Salinimonas sediminis]AXR05173.1 Dyp-type peroxidase [Salinimonas sediminis]
MTQPQKGICAEPNLHAHYLLLNVIDDDAQTIRATLPRLLDLFEFYENEHYEAMVTGVVAIGASFWDELYDQGKPGELHPFPAMQCEDRSAPDTGCDLFIQVRADRLDICHAMACDIMELLHLHVELVEQVQGFRYLDGRDLNGFVYASDNPRGMTRRQVAIVDAQLEPDFAGGSYVHVQRYQHDLRRWRALSERQQEQVMGKTREHDRVSVEQSASSHSLRGAAVLPGASTPGLLKQGMPYGDLLVQGLFFISCSASAQAFETMLHSQIVGNSEGDYDRWLDFTSAQSGGAYFAPAVTFIRQQASR